MQSVDKATRSEPKADGGILRRRFWMLRFLTTIRAQERPILLYPPGAKSYNKGKPIRIEEFEGERAWWGQEDDGFKSRVENEQAWRVSIDTIKAGNFNLDLKNPHNPDTGPGDVDHLLPEYEKLLAQIAATRAALKQELHHALTATAGTAE